jgi:hypothetical protein
MTRIALKLPDPAFLCAQPSEILLNMRARLPRTLFGCAAAALLAACEPAQVLTVTPVLEVEDQRLDFGPVPEGMTAVRGVRVLNPVSVVVEGFTVALDPGGSPDFTVLTSSTSSTAIAPGQQVEVQVRFRPEGAGSDEATLRISSPYLADGEVAVFLSGGPIAPCVRVEPDPLDFGPAATATVVRTFELINDCQANLTVDSVTLAEDGNPDFTVRRWETPAVIRPGARRAGAIDYRRSARATAGRLQVRADDPEAPMVEVRLLPDPLRACQDGEDNDADGLLDFPDDPGCASPEDDDEANPPECAPGATEPCGSDVGACAPGTRACVEGRWGPCEGATVAADETCDGLDDDCDGAVDEAITEACDAFGCAGVRACVEDSGVEGGAWTACVPTSPEPERCDGVDNDCDGTVDDGIVEACQVSTCAGTRICVPGGAGEFTACQVSPQPELCNGADDDCNGVPDDLPALTCGVGACAATAPACAGGAPNTCVPGAPTPELCNGLDDDCSGVPDDNGACTAPMCGLGVATADPQEPNDTPGAANPRVPATLGTRTLTYDVTLPPGDEDWLEFTFPAPGAASVASLSARATCVSWAGNPGCAQPARVGLAAWYFDDVCTPGGQQDGYDAGAAGLPFVSSSGSVSPFGICVPQRFRLRVFAGAAVCTAEALNVELEVTITFQ